MTDKQTPQTIVYVTPDHDTSMVHSPTVTLNAPKRIKAKRIPNTIQFPCAS